MDTNSCHRHNSIQSNPIMFNQHNECDPKDFSSLLCVRLCVCQCTLHNAHSSQGEGVGATLPTKSQPFSCPRVYAVRFCRLPVAATSSGTHRPTPMGTATVEFLKKEKESMHSEKERTKRNRPSARRFMIYTVIIRYPASTIKLE